MNYQTINVVPVTEIASPEFIRQLAAAVAEELKAQEGKASDQELKDADAARILRVSVEEDEPYPDYRGFVYVIKCEHLYKIGCSKTPLKRIKSLSCTSAFQIKTMTIITADNMRRAELYLHKKFRHKRRHGEWFELSERDLNRILEIKTL